VLFSRLSKVTPAEWQERAVPLLDRWARYSPLLPITVGLHLIVFGDDFLVLWIGKRIPEAPAIFTMLVLPLFFSVPAACYSTAALARAKPAVAAFIQVGEAVMNVGLSIVMVQYCGIVGAAIGTFCAAITFQGVVSPLAVQGLVNYPLGRYLRQAIFASVVLLPLYGMILLISRYYCGAATTLQFIVANGLPLVLLVPTVVCCYVAKEDRGYLVRRMGFR
jgi:O-antigen/teichoic acid export membrane protein